MMVRVKKLHTRKFYKQLKGHLKSPGTKKILKNCKVEENALHRPQVSIKASPMKAKHRKLRRKAGETSNDTSDLFFEPAINRTQLVKEKVKLSKMITASVVAKNDDSSFHETSQKDEDKNVSVDDFGVIETLSHHSCRKTCEHAAEIKASDKETSSHKSPESSMLKPPSTCCESTKINHLKAWLNSCPEISKEAGHTTNADEAHDDTNKHSCFYLDRSSDSESSVSEDGDFKNDVCPIHDLQKPSSGGKTLTRSVLGTTDPLHNRKSAPNTTTSARSQARSLSENLVRLPDSRGKHPFSVPTSSRLPGDSCRDNSYNTCMVRHPVVENDDENALLDFKPFEQRWEEFLAKTSQELSPDVERNSKVASPSREFELVPGIPTETEPTTNAHCHYSENVVWSDSSDGDVKEKVRQMSALIQESRKARSPTKYYGLNPDIPHRETPSPQLPRCPKNISWGSSSEDEIDVRLARWDASSTESADLALLKHHYLTMENNRRFLTSQEDGGDSPRLEDYYVVTQVIPAFWAAGDRTMSHNPHSLCWLLMVTLQVLQWRLPAVDAVQAMKCSNWYLRAPEHGKLSCDHVGEEALVGTICRLTCAANYAPSEEVMTCQFDGSWHPTKSPTCIADGSLTVIVVPAVVGTLVVLFVVGFIYAQVSKRCQKRMRSHEDVEEGGGNVRPGKEFADAHKSSQESYAMEEPPEQKTERKIKKQKKSAAQRLGGIMPKKFGLPRGLLRRRLRGLKPRWRSSGPKRVVGRPDGVGESSVCGDVEWQDRISGSSAPESSSSSEERSSSSSEEEQEVEEKEEIKEELKKTSSSKTKKVPPPRPPAPKVKKSSRSSAPHHKPRKNASSGYSSDEAHQNKKKRKPTSKPEKKEVASKKKVSKGNAVNPYDNYPVAGSDRQYLDFENDYRKNEHIFEAGAYHPQYHPIKSFPIKPAHKKGEKSRSRSEDREKKKKKSRDDRDEEKDHVPTGGVKYYSIKQDRDEIKRHKKRLKRRRDRSRERSKDARKKEKHDGRRKERDGKDRERSRRKRTESERRRRHKSSSRKKKSKEKRRERSKNDEDSSRRRKRSSKHHRGSSEKHRSHRKVAKTSDED